MELVNFIFVNILCLTVISGRTVIGSEIAKTEINKKLIIEKFPFQVSVEVDKKPVCGGVILGDQWVLTANTCIPLNVKEVHRVKIRAGSSYLGSGGTSYSVIKMVRNNFARYFPTFDFDIGMIKIEIPFSYAPTVQWSRPAIDFLNNRDHIVIAGWGLKGRHKDNKRHSKVVMKSAKVKMISESLCRHKYEGKLNITKSMACLVPATSKDNACIGDVGSPVTVSGLVAGVVANNKFCWQRKYPLVVTDIGNAGFFLTLTMAEPVLRKP